MNEKIVIVPVGGLGNRMRSVASAVALAREAGKELRVMWFQDWALGAKFSALFRPISHDGVTVHECSGTDYLLYDRPRRKNFHLPKLAQRCMFRSCLYEEQMPALIRSQFDFLGWARRGGGYLSSCYAFYPYSDELIRSLFRPLPEIEAEIDRRCASFAPYTIGVHVRRTDHVVAKAESPIELFFDAIDREEATHPDLRIYLATDSEEVKQQMRERYADKVITAPTEAERGTTQGIRDGLVDMYALSRAQIIYGSCGSSFSELAAALGNVPIIALREKKNLR